MADNYLQFSEQIEIRTPAERQWLLDQTDIDELRAEESRIEKIQDKELSQQAIDQSPMALLGPFIECQGMPFSCAFESAGFWLYSEDSGDVEAAARLVQAFFQKFRPDGRFTLTWSESSSRPRLGEFGGGACLVTALTIETFSAHEWIEQRVAALDQK